MNDSEGECGKCGEWKIAFKILLEISPSTPRFWNTKAVTCPSIEDRTKSSDTVEDQELCVLQASIDDRRSNELAVGSLFLVCWQENERGYLWGRIDGKMC